MEVLEVGTYSDGGFLQKRSERACVRLDPMLPAEREFLAWFLGALSQRRLGPAALLMPLGWRDS